MVDIPNVERLLANINDLSTDGKNPNSMSNSQFDALKKNIKEFGFLVPIITNKEYVIADGEHRYNAAKELGMKEVPIVRLDVNEVDRRILRQVMNKLRGEHDKELDMEEYKFLFDNQADQRLRDFMAMKDKEFQIVTDYIRSLPKESLPDDVPEDNLPLVKKGEVYVLGRHRLICGDSTDADVVNKLMGGGDGKYAIY